MRWIIAGLAALILSGCAAEQQMQHYVPPSVVAAVAAPTDSVLPGVPAAPEQTRIPIPTPLTSDKPPRGGAWKTMHANGYTGSLGEACALLGVTSEQCAAAAAAHERGQCEVMTVQNGTVLDGLTFTRGGQHRVQKHVLVALVNPPSWLMEVCSVGEGVYIVRFHGCNNFAVIRMKDKAPTPPPVATIPPVAQTCFPVDSAAPASVNMRIGRSLTSQILMTRSAEQMGWVKQQNGRYKGTFCYLKTSLPAQVNKDGTSLCTPRQAGNENSYLSPTEMSRLETNEYSTERQRTVRLAF